MATLVTIRTPAGERWVLAIAGDRFVDPDTVDIDREFATSELWALPGLADAHAHLTMTNPSDIGGLSDETMIRNIPATSWAHVERGVLLILDKGAGSDLSLITLHHDEDLRPEAEVAGALIRPAGGYMPGFGAEVSPNELSEHVRTKASKAGGWVKIIGDWPRRGQGPVSNYSLEQLAEAVEIVHAAGARVAVHTMAFAASDAVAAGVDSIEHGPFLTQDDLVSLGARNGAWVPTIANMESVREMLGPDSSGGRMFTEGLNRVRENLPLAEDAGVTVLAGTDLAIPHGTVSIEAERLHAYGLTSAAATDAASTNAYRYTGRTDRLSAGSPASAVFFDQNPYDRIETLQHPALVVHRGRLIEGSRAGLS
ncbi:MAG: amidohydrolase family protein [Acidimicrobiia bacterium]|nr:amidohydrolase family protein [Acidimicrobiia bacterium]